MSLTGLLGGLTEMISPLGMLVVTVGRKSGPLVYL